MNGSSGDGLLNNQRTAYHHHQVEGKLTEYVCGEGVELLVEIAWQSERGQQ